VKYLEVVDVMVGQLLRRLAEAEEQVCYALRSGYSRHVLASADYMSAHT